MPLFGKRRSERGVVQPCDFCGALDSDGGQLLGRPAIRICRRCVDRAAREIARELESARVLTDVVRADPCCSFCRKARDRVRRLLAGPDVFICSECVSLADALETELRTRSART